MVATAQRRKKIGILFIFKSRWLGGLYYLLNIIESFNYLPEEQQPDLIIFYNKRTENHLNSVKYTKVKFVEIDVDFNLTRYLKSFFLNKNLFFIKEFSGHDLDVIFPFNDFVGKDNRNKISLVSWIPDFQHKFYPRYFNRTALILREFRFRRIVSQSDGLILSSQSAFDHFMQFYNPPSSIKVSIARFTSIIDTKQLQSGDSIRKKYDIHNDYFIVCNQFYGHKNHLIVVKALKILKDQGIKYNVVFTSKPDQAKDVQLLTEIEQYIADNDLGSQVMLLGMLPRIDQLSLMQSAISVIQPSKFEGWSTVIEDAKTLQKFIIASNLPVHIEQIEKNGLFFDPEDASTLADNMCQAKTKVTGENLWGSLSDRTADFASGLLSALYYSQRKS